MAAPIITAAAISPECSFMFMPIKRASGIVGSLTFGSDYCICLLAQHLLMFVREIGERKKEREDRKYFFFLKSITWVRCGRMGVESLPVLIMGPESEKATTELANVSGTELADGG